MFKKNVENFTCINCSTHNKGDGYTDHCSNCLYGLHVDITPGDREESCRGIMIPVKSEYKDSNYDIFYQCHKCNASRKNRSHKDDEQQLLIDLINK